MAAMELKRSVRVVLTRDQMFTFGYRPETIQTLALGAGSDGKLQAIMHEAVAETSQLRGLPGGGRQLVGPALPVRQCPSSTTSWRSSTATRRATCARPVRRSACLRSNPPWTSWPMHRRRPARAAAAQLRRDRPERGQAVHQQGLARLLPAGCGAVRLVAARAAAALDARWPRADRLGHGDRRLGGADAADQRRAPC